MPVATRTTAPAESVRNDPQRYLALATSHYENFPVGSWLLPRAARLHLRRIYAFARTADDLADELRDGPALTAFRCDFLRHLDDGVDDVRLFVDLRASIRECALETHLFTDLLDAFDQDLVQRRYDRAGLFAYCRRSADPVGRLVLRVCGHRDNRLDALSDRICTALQLLNHLQDLGEDLRVRDRIYFPQEDLKRFGVGEEQLRASHADAAVRALVQHWAHHTATEFAAGWPLVDAVGGRLRWELRAILRGAAGVLERIRAVGGDVLGHSTKLAAGARLRTVLGGLCLRRAPRFVTDDAATGSA